MTPHAPTMNAPSSLTSTSRAMTSVESLPAEIFLELASYLSSRSDVFQLSQVVRPGCTSAQAHIAGGM